MLSPKINFTVMKQDSSTLYDYDVTFSLNKSCNLKCSYCAWNSGPVFENSIQCIKNLYEYFNIYNCRNIMLYIHGGESTITTFFEEFLDTVNMLSKKYSINTTLELQTNFTIRKNLLNILNKITKLSISFHYTELKNKNLLPVFLKNIDIIIKNNLKIDRFDIMLEYIEKKDDLEEFYRICEYILKYKNLIFSEMIYSFMLVSKEYNDRTKNMHIEFFKKFNKNVQMYNIDGKFYDTNELMAEGLTCKEMNCLAGVNILYITGDGVVKKCAGVNYNNKKSTYITNILTDSLFMKKLKIFRSIKRKCNCDVCLGDYYIDRSFN